MCALPELPWQAGGAEELRCASSGRDGHYRIGELLPVSHRVSGMARGFVPMFHTRGEGEAPRTHRYLQGSVERAERAQRLAGDCARAVLRTLRGALMSVPLRPPDDGACEAKSTF